MLAIFCLKGAYIRELFLRINEKKKKKKEKKKERSVDALNDKYVWRLQEGQRLYQ